MPRYETASSGNMSEYPSGMHRDTDEGKVKWHLVADGPMLQRWAELLTRGAVLYGDRNWQQADSLEEWARFRESAFRHFIQWWTGYEDEDHAAAVLFNINCAEYVANRLDPTL